MKKFKDSSILLSGETFLFVRRGVYLWRLNKTNVTAQNMKFSIKDFFIFCAVCVNLFLLTISSSAEVIPKSNSMTLVTFSYFDTTF